VGTNVEAFVLRARTGAVVVDGVGGGDEIFILLEGWCVCEGVGWGVCGGWGTECAIVGVPGGKLGGGFRGDRGIAE
jgi:hypothetical protein